MAIIAAQKLGKSFGENRLFQDVSFEIAQKDRIGLIGANGTGKTTLLKILQGLEQAEEGEVHRAKLLRIACLEQAPELIPNQSVYELTLEVFAPLMELERQIDLTNAALTQEHASYETLVKRQGELHEAYEREGGLTYRARTRSALLGLGFDQQQLDQPATSLSGGQLGKALLARVLLRNADFLLLDEPTNHLDIAAVEWLEHYLKSYAGAFLIISHDRYFLDQVTNQTFELYQTRFFASKGNYSAHVEQRATGQEIIARHYYNTQKEIRRIYGIVEQQRRWNRERNIRTAESKLKQIDRLKATLVAPEKEQEHIHFSFQVRQPGGNDVLIAEDLKKSYGNSLLFAHANLHMRQGERVCLLGPNGCGKTTLLRILMGKEAPDAGLSYFGVGVEPAYYEQNMRSLRPERTVLEEVWSAYPRMSQTKVRNALAAFLFRGADVEKKIEMLSGGEKARVQLLKLMLSGSNLLLLDEPTNHLDIASREALEQALLEYEGALLVVTHDRYLVNKIADRVLYMRQNELVETIGGYDSFLEALSGQEAPETEKAEPPKPKNTYQQQKEKKAAYNKAKLDVRRVEQNIEQAEAEIALLEQQLLLPEVMADYQQAGALVKRLEAQREALDAAYLEWEAAQAVLGRLEGEE